MIRNYRESIANLLLKEQKVNIISEIPSRITCTLCSHVIVDARQSPCGCRYCYECIMNYLKNESTFCPGQSTECRQEELILGTNVINDFGTDQEIRRLYFRCHNDECTFEGQVRLMDEHLESCLYGVKNCEFCGEQIRRLEILEHSKKECPERLKTCKYCGKDIAANIMDSEHNNIKSEKVCSMYQCICPLKCDITKLVILEKHRLVCANRPRTCPFNGVGCPAKGYTKREINNHINQHMFEHSKILFDALEHYKEKVDALENEMKYFKDTYLSFVWKVEGVFRDKTRTKVFSPTFSLSLNSYKARMKIDIEENFQLFFMIVQGEYDDMLQWPFDRQVAISIIDRSGEGKHYIKTLKASMNLECFKRPIEKTKGYGWDNFIDINILKDSNNLLRDDCLFIKCTMHS